MSHKEAKGKTWSRSPQPISLDRETLAITISIGVSELQQDEASMRPLQMRADTALYQAKNTGRNRVVLV